MRCRAVWMLALAGALAACDSGPSGPGSVPVTVTGDPSLGAVVVEVVGVGIEGFEGLGSTQAYGTLLDAEVGRHRVLLVNQGSGDIHFGIRMASVRSPIWAVTVVLAADAENRPMSAASLSARVEAPSG